MRVSYKTPVGDPNRPVPTLSDDSVEMEKGDCVGSYTFYTSTYEGLGDLDYATKIDVVSGTGATARQDAFKAASDLGATCITFDAPPQSLCSDVEDPGPPVTTSTPTVTATGAAPTETLHHRPTVGNYTLVGCQTDTVPGTRALGGASFVYDGMTLESCMKNCTGYYYWGTEYGRECKFLASGP